jgi:hypothetical protein
MCCRLNKHRRCDLSVLSIEYVRPDPCFESVADRLYSEDPFGGVIDPDLADKRDTCVVQYTRMDGAPSKELRFDSFLCHMVTKSQLKGTLTPRRSPYATASPVAEPSRVQLK